MNKSDLRKIFLQKRQSLSQADWQRKSDQICEHLARSSLFQSANTVLSFCSFRQEPDLSSLLSASKRWGLPRCVDRSLIWHQWTPEIPLHKGAFGIVEPPAYSPILSSEHVDLMLVPCVACDRDGYRLGYGGGFYDRLFAQPEWNKSTIGILFEFALIERLRIDPWDKPLTAICTETGLR